MDGSSKLDLVLFENQMSLCLVSLIRSGLLVDFPQCQNEEHYHLSDQIKEIRLSGNEETPWLQVFQGMLHVLLKGQKLVRLRSYS